MSEATRWPRCSCASGCTSCSIHSASATAISQVILSKEARAPPADARRTPLLQPQPSLIGLSAIGAASMCGLLSARAQTPG